MKHLIAYAVVIAAGGALQAQPALDKSTIPADMVPELRERIEKLYSSSATTRANGAIELREFRAAFLKPAIPYLAGILQDDAPLKISVSYNPFGGIPTSPGEEAARTLAKTGEEALPVFASGLKDTRAAVRKSSAVGLGEMRSAPAVEPLLKCLAEEGQIKVVLAVLEALGKVDDPRSKAALIKALSEQEWEVRRQAAEALLSQSGKSQELIAPFLKFLKEARSHEEEFSLVSQIENKLGDITGIHGRNMDAEWEKWAISLESKKPTK